MYFENPLASTISATLTTAQLVFNELKILPLCSYQTAIILPLSPLLVFIRIEPTFSKG